jgi:putative FmdB family regulatory protein
MPWYEYACASCGEDFDAIRSVADRESPIACTHCDSMETDLKISLSSFILKGHGWAGKDMRIKKQMEKRRQRQRGRQEEKKREEGIGMKMIPNVDGEQTESWADAQKLAKSKGKDTSSYDRVVSKERKEANS